MSARLLCIVSLLIALFAPASGAPAFYGVICGADGPRLVALPGDATSSEDPDAARHHCALCAALPPVSVPPPARSARLRGPKRPPPGPAAPRFRRLRRRRARAPPRHALRNTA